MAGRSASVRCGGRGVRLRRLLLAVVCGCAPLLAPADTIDAADRRLLADALYAREMHEQAMREYAVLAADPAVAERETVLFRLAESCRRLKRNTDAEAAYARLAAEFPKGRFFTQAQLQRALLAAEGKRFADAVALLTPLAENAAVPADLAPALLQTLADALERGGDAAGALARYGQLRTRFPQSEYAAPAAIKQAYAEAQTGRRTRAAELYREAATLAKTPRVAAEARFQLGQTLAADGQAKAAAQAFADLRQHHPGDPRLRDAARAAAWACHDAGDYEGALAWIPADGGADAEREAFLYIRANCERQRGRLAEAAEAYRAFLRACPGSPRLPRARYELLLTLFRAGRHAELLEAAEGLQPEAAWAADVAWMRAEAAAALKQGERAAALYREVGEKHPQSPFAGDAWIRAGWLLHDREAWREAAQAFQTVVARHPQHPQAAQALYAAGVCLARGGDAEGALASWKTLDERFPKYEGLDEARFQTAMEWLRLKRDAEAVAAFDRLLAAHPGSKRRAEGHYWRGVLRRQRDDAVGAVADFREAVAGDAPAEIAREARLALGGLLLQQDDEAGAATAFQPLLEGAARDALPPDRLAWLAEFQFARGALAEAETAARALAARDAGAAWAQTGWALLGRVLRARKKGDEAIDAYTRAADQAAETRHLPEALLRLGELLADAGKIDQAEQRLRETVAKTSAPEWQGIRAHAYAALGRCAEARGQNEEALRYFLSVALLYDDPALVPMALDKAAALHLALGRIGDSEKIGRELVDRYPGSAQAKAWRARLDAKTNQGGARP